MTTIAVVPDRSLEQRRSALAHANATRTARARLKRDIRVGQVQLADVIADPPHYAQAAKLIDLLLQVPKCGRVKSQKIIRAAGVSPSKTLTGLTGRQRDALVDALTGPPR